MNDLLPPNCEVAVVGAGITGLSVALHLVREGVSRVVVIDRTGIAAEASGVQPGGVRQQWSVRVNCLLARESAAFYRELHEHLESSIEAELERCGYIFLAHSKDQLERLRADVAVQNAAGVPSVILTPEQAAEVVPDLQTESLVGAAWCHEDGYFDRPQSVIEVFAEAAQAAGVAITRANVQSVTPRNGRCSLTMADGRTVAADRVVLATGCDTPALVGPLGIDLRIRTEPRYLFFSDPIKERLLEPLVVSAERRFAAKQLANGRVLASDLTLDGEGDARDPGARRNAIRQHIEELLPRLQYVSLPLLVEGFYDTTPDHQPVVGQVAENLWVSAGYSGHGFMLAPAVGRRLARAIAGRAEDDLLAAFALERYSGAELTHESAIV